MEKTMEANKAVVRRLYEAGWAQGDLAAIEAAFAPVHVLHWNELAPTDQRRTVEDVKQIVMAYRAAVPDLQVTLDHLVAEGDQVAVQVTFAGTHTGPYEGYAPTGKRGRFTDMQILRLAGGQIVESSLGSGGLRYFFDMLTGALFEA